MSGNSTSRPNPRPNVGISRNACPRCYGPLPCRDHGGWFVAYSESLAFASNAGRHMPLFEIYPPNTHGNDFVVGDLHGHRQQLLAELDRIRFDRSRAPLFSTGDLIDRGPGSVGTLALGREPWVCFVTW